MAIHLPVISFLLSLNSLVDLKLSRTPTWTACPRNCLTRRRVSRRLLLRQPSPRTASGSRCPCRSSSTSWTRTRSSSTRTRRTRRRRLTGRGRPALPDERAPSAPSWRQEGGMPMMKKRKKNARENMIPSHLWQVQGCYRTTSRSSNIETFWGGCLLNKRYLTSIHATYKSSRYRPKNLTVCPI